MQRKTCADTYTGLTLAAKAGSYSKGADGGTSLFLSLFVIFCSDDKPIDAFLSLPFHCTCVFHIASWEGP